ncbi:MAG: hypothetical protein ABIA67_07090, partial [Candidatus Margulisiibacteriota bacterium]
MGVLGTLSLVRPANMTAYKAFRKVGMGRKEAQQALKLKWGDQQVFLGALQEISNNIRASLFRPGIMETDSNLFPTRKVENVAPRIDELQTPRWNSSMAILGQDLFGGSLGINRSKAPSTIG